MKKSLSFEDVLLQPQFSFVKSRKDVSTNTKLCGINLKLGIISSNMDTVTESGMARAMESYGALGSLHRFQSIEDNVKMFKASPITTICSIGITDKELERAEALVAANCLTLMIDVAHAGSIEVVRQLQDLRRMFKDNVAIIVGNFANSRTIRDFNYHSGNLHVDAIKSGIGPGSGCLTRVVTGVGGNALGSLMDCVTENIPVICDGGLKNSGDFSKAMAAGAVACMMGGLLASCSESPGEVIDAADNKKYKKYRGSASTESYEVQGKVASHRSYEGDSFLVPYTGPVANTLRQFEAGLRSSMSYLNATNLKEFRENAEWIELSASGAAENKAHGRNRSG